MTFMAFKVASRNGLADGWINGVAERGEEIVWLVLVSSSIAALPLLQLYLHLYWP